eukprot:m.30827 g.30827  ORF g.30827 m.30827 type:complete len:176 (+) comp8245_c0_seq1:119-646(+)
MAGIPPSAVQKPPSRMDTHPFLSNQGNPLGNTQMGTSDMRIPLNRYRDQERLKKDMKVLPQGKIQELVKQIDPNQTLETEVEDLLQEMANDFIERVVTFSCQLAKHRGSDKLEAKDVQLHLERNWNIRVPGVGREDMRINKAPKVPETHKQRVIQVQKDAETLAKKRKLEHDKAL